MKLILRRKCVPNKAPLRENSPEHTYLKKHFNLQKFNSLETAPN